MKRKIALLLVFVLSISLFITGCADKLDAEKLIKIELKGANGYGTVVPTVNGAYAGPTLQEILQDKNNPHVNKEMIKNSVQGKYLDSFTYEIEGAENGKLWNGDKITIHILDNEGLAEEANLKLSKKELSYEVEGLPEADVYNPFEHISVEFTGTDEAGYLEITENDWPPFALDFMVQLEDQEKPLSPYEVTNLRNDQEVKIVVKYDEEMALSMGYVVGEKEKTYKVEGLKVYDKVSADTLFDGFTYSFTGASPKLSITVENDLPDDLYGYFDFSVDPSYDLKIGDIIKITVYGDEYALNEAGKSFPAGSETREYELTEDMVPKYLQDLKALSKEDKAFLQAEALDHMTQAIGELQSYGWDYFASFLEKSQRIKTYGTPAIDSIYLLYPKESMIDKVGGTINSLVFIYKCSLGNKDGENFDGYHAVALQNIIVQPSGEIDRSSFDIDETYEFNTRDSEYASFVDSQRGDYSVTELKAADFE